MPLVQVMQARQSVHPHQLRTNRGACVVSIIELLTVPEIARELRVSQTTVYRLIDAGELPHTPVGKRRKLVTRQQLDAYLAASAVDPNELETQAARIRAARDRIDVQAS